MWFVPSHLWILGRTERMMEACAHAHTYIDKSTHISSIYIYIYIAMTRKCMQMLQSIPTRLEGKQSVLQPSEVQSLPSDTCTTEVEWPTPFQVYQHVQTITLSHHLQLPDHKEKPNRFPSTRHEIITKSLQTTYSQVLTSAAWSSWIVFPAASEAGATVLPFVPWGRSRRSTSKGLRRFQLGRHWRSIMINHH